MVEIAQRDQLQVNFLVPAMKLSGLVHYVRQVRFKGFLFFCFLTRISQECHIAHVEQQVVTQLSENYVNKRKNGEH